MRLGSLRSVPVAAPSVQGKPCKARNGRWTGRPHRESPRASVSASPVTIYHNACLKTQSDRLLEDGFTDLSTAYLTSPLCNGENDEPPLGAKEGFALRPCLQEQATKA